MTALITGLGFAASLAAALLVYLGAPNQRMLGRALPFRRAMIAGIAVSLAALILFFQVLGPATSIFALLVVQMTVWTFAPFAALLVRHTGKTR